MPHLPLFIKDTKDSALIWVETRAELEAQLKLCEEACLMDSQESFWHWHTGQLESSSDAVPLSELNTWVQAWATQLNQCCTTKLQVRSYADVLEAVEYLDNI